MKFLVVVACVLVACTAEEGRDKRTVLLGGVAPLPLVRTGPVLSSQILSGPVVSAPLGATTVLGAGTIAAAPVLSGPVLAAPLGTPLAASTIIGARTIAAAPVLPLGHNIVW